MTEMEEPMRGSNNGKMGQVTSSNYVFWQPAGLSSYHGTNSSNHARSFLKKALPKPYPPGSYGDLATQNRKSLIVFKL